MQNVEYSVDKNNILTVKVDLTKDFGPSGSGKTTIVGSTGAAAMVAEGIFMGLNVYKKAPK